MLRVERHRLGGRPRRRGAWVPAVAAAGGATLGALDAVSPPTPDTGWRDRLLTRIEPDVAVPLFHALAVPASVGLVATAFYLGRRRRRAWAAAVAFLVALGALNVLKGLDVEEAVVSFALAGALAWCRDAFPVRHDPIRLRTLVALPALAAAVALPAALAAFVAVPAGAGGGAVLREAAALVSWSRPPFAFRDELARIPLALGLLALGAGLAALRLLFRPLRP